MVSWSRGFAIEVKHLPRHEIPPEIGVIQVCIDATSEGLLPVCRNGVCLLTWYKSETDSNAMEVL